MSEKISTSSAPGAIGPYSQAVTSGNLVFTSGQIALDPKTGEITGNTIEEQTARVCENLKAVLEASGSSLNSALKTVCYLRYMNNFSKFNEVYGSYFTNKPARSCVEVSCLPKGVLVEVDVIAEKEN